MVTTQRSRGRGGGGQLDRLAFAFDDQRVVANAGLLLASTLAGRLGIEQIVDEMLDLGALLEVSEWLEGILGRQLEGQLYRAGVFPPARGTS